MRQVDDYVAIEMNANMCTAISLIGTCRNAEGTSPSIRSTSSFGCASRNTLIRRAMSPRELYEIDGKSPSAVSSFTEHPVVVYEASVIDTFLDHANRTDKHFWPNIENTFVE
ncbi:hypothetical protein DVH05_021617 [Phytophthora capsici]|nr:hypothetical protein DVH05_021617 [Phytophthora capsici]